MILFCIIMRHHDQRTLSCSMGALSYPQKHPYSTPVKYGVDLSPQQSVCVAQCPGPIFLSLSCPSVVLKGIVRLKKGSDEGLVCLLEYAQIACALVPEQGSQLESGSRAMTARLARRTMPALAGPAIPAILPSASKSRTIASR